MKYLLTILFLFNLVYACTCSNPNNVTTTCCINTPGNLGNVTINLGGLLVIESDVTINNLTFTHGAITIRNGAKLTINNSGNLNLNGLTRFNVFGELIINSNVSMSDNNSIYVEENAKTTINGNIVINSGLTFNGLIICGEFEVNGNFTFNSGSTIRFCNYNNAVLNIDGNLSIGNGIFDSQINNCHNINISGNGTFNNSSVNNSSINLCVDGNITGLIVANEDCSGCGVLEIKERKVDIELIPSEKELTITNSYILLNAYDRNIVYSVYDVLGKLYVKGVLMCGNTIKLYYDDYNITGLFFVIVNNKATLTQKIP